MNYRKEFEEYFDKLEDKPMYADRVDWYIGYSEWLETKLTEQRRRILEEFTQWLSKEGGNKFTDNVVDRFLNQ